jgi:hypothetical protein
MKITKTNLAFEIFCIGFIIVMYELLQIRLLSFFLGSISNFLAIPLALLGLAIGSIFYHFFQKIFSLRIKEIITSSIFPVLALSFLLFFYIANNYFADIHISLSYPSRDSLRLLIYTLVFLPAYCLGGVMLSYFFSNKSEHIGNLYCFDLLGASSAALLTPILLTYYGLKIPIYILLLFSLLLLLKQRLFNREIKIFLSLFFCLILYLANDGHILTEHPNPRILSRTLLKKYLKKDYLVTEQTTNWNSLARTSLLQAKNTNSGNTKYAVVQDDGVSNVHVLSYRNSIKKDQLLENPSHHALPFLLGANPKSILVMFAGVGRDMILLDILANKKAKIIGVELNPAVVDIATNSVLKEFEIDNFIARKNISLLAMEGRDFLNGSMEKFDLIYVATNGSIHANKTGHSRKYLDTYQALEAYLKLLNDGVMLSYFFSNKSEHIGNLYCFDLLGASSAALLTPILLTYYGLKIPIYILLLFSLLLLLKQRLFNREIKIFLSLFFCLILYLANDGHILTEHPNPRILSRTLLKKYLKKDYLVTEQTTNWNSLARTSLLQAKNTNSGNTKYAVVQDDGVSNVHVLSYRNSIKKDQLLV